MSTHKPKVLLIMEPPSNTRFYANTLPPLGPLSIFSYLRTKDIEVDFLDRNVKSERKISFIKYNIFGLTLNVSNVEKSLATIRLIRKENKEAKIIVGGPLCSCYPEKLIEVKEIDAVTLGEGEETCYEYIISDNKMQVKGLYLKNENGTAFFTGKRAAIDQLDRLPFPSLDVINLKDYHVPISKEKVISSILTSRGCPFSCSFCFNHFGRKWRARTAQSVIDEIQWQVDSLGAKEICIVDDNFSLDASRSERIFQGVLDKNIKVKFQFLNGIRIDNITFDLLKLFHKAGVWLISIAPESGDEDTVKRIEKKVNPEKFYEIVDWCRQIGIATFGFFMMGFPWETSLSAKKTRDYILKLNTDFMQLSNVEIYPNTELYTDYGRTVQGEIFHDKNLFSNDSSLKNQVNNNLKFSDLRKDTYRRFYLNPKRMLNLLRRCPFPSLVKLFKYALLTKNI